MGRSQIERLKRLLPFMSERERAELAGIVALDRKAAIWRPQPGPQTMAYYSDAKIIGFGGAAGGGKTDLGVGKALMQHTRSMIFRKEGTELGEIEERLRELGCDPNNYNASRRIWRNPVPGATVVFGSVPNPGDETKYRGRSRDYLFLDESVAIPFHQVQFLMGWVRTVVPGQKCEVLMTFNPPSRSEGRWVVDYFAPWLDEGYPLPAAPGELRWFARLGGEEIEADGPTPIMWKGELITPESRTFIPSRVADNVYLDPGYMATLQALPEPLRSQLLYGDFKAGMGDDPWQVIPTAWVDAAMRRWRKLDPKPRMDSQGVDVARGGDDRTTIANRHALWFDEALVYPGTQTPDGPKVGALTAAANRDHAPIHIDVIGVGASPYDWLVYNRFQTIGVDMRAGTLAKDKSGRLGFMNTRSWIWWRMREILDPASNLGVALPPDKQLFKELTSVHWEPRGNRIYVESREDIVDRIGYSPDLATAYVLAAMDTPRVVDLPGKQGPQSGEYNPYEKSVGHDPYAR